MLSELVDRPPESRMRSARPCIRPHFRVEIVEPMHVYLLGEHASHALSGRLYGMVVPLLDGQRTLDEIRRELPEAIAGEVLDQVLDRLRRLGFLVDAADGMAPGAAAFWSELGFDPGEVAPLLGQCAITLTAVGEVSDAPLRAALTEAGLVVGSPATASLQVVVTDDYLRPELERINREALDSGRPWMLAKPVGSVVWLGPVFAPGDIGCWECLAQRLRGNLEVKASIIRQRKGEGDPADCLPTARPAFGPTVSMAASWATTEIAKWIAARALGLPGEGAARTEILAGKILTLDHVNHACRSHAAPHRPQCPCCGDPQLVARRGFQPIALAAAPKLGVDDGRTVSPEQTVERHSRLVSPISGVVMELTRVSDPANRLVNTYKSSHSMGAVGSLRGLRKILRHTASGKGKTSAQAQASGLCEAVERYSVIWQGDEPRVKAAMAELGDAAVHPELCLQFSDAQYADREALNAQAGVGNNWVPHRFAPDRAIDWTPAWSLTHDRQRFLPTAYFYPWFPQAKDYEFCIADSNGNAAGNTLEEAIYQGLLEVIERDAAALWWYNRVNRPAVDLASFDDPYFRDLERFYRDIGRELWVLDLTSDLGVPVMAAVSRRTTGTSERLIIGFGAHLDPAIAVTRALTEMSQVGLELDKLPDEQIDPDSAEWLLGATLANQPYLAPGRSTPARRAGDFPLTRSDDIRGDVEMMVEAARRVGVEVLVIDMTRPDIGLNVVKVIAPGMRFFWRRFAPGRLYDTPVKLGWLSEPTPEDQLNPISMPF